MPAVPLTEGPVQGDGLQRVEPSFQDPAHTPDLFPIPTAAPWPLAGYRDRNLPLAGEGLTALHQAVRGGSAAGTTAPCQASNGNCARRGNLGLGVSLPYPGICPVCGVSTALTAAAAPGAAVGTRACASHKTPATATAKGWTWPWVCQGARGPGGVSVSPGVGLADGGCPRAP